MTRPYIVWLLALAGMGTLVPEMAFAQPFAQPLPVGESSNSPNNANDANNNSPNDANNDSPNSNAPNNPPLNSNSPQSNAQKPPANPAPANNAAAQQNSGPNIVLPPDEPPQPPPVQLQPPQLRLQVPRGVDPTITTGQGYATDLGAGRRIPIGAYGEAMMLSTHDATQLRLRRVVLFFGYRFADWVSVYSELEVEDVEDFEIEQSFLEFTPFKKLRLGFKVGLILIPLGIINQYHEPPTFNGVDRPLVDQLIIPTTWRELGAGVFGDIIPGLHYQLYGIAGADGSKFTATGAIGPGLSRGFTINTENAAVTGRINFNRVLGLDVAAGFYYGTANSKEASLTGISVALVEGDARFTRWGLSLRAEYARIFITGAGKITTFLRTTVPTAEAIGSQAQGFYFEAGYNVLHLLRRTEQQVMPFARYEYVDTRAVVPDVTNPQYTDGQQFLTAGLTYRPLLYLAFKFDYRRTLAGNDGTGGRDRYSLGVAFMY